MAELAFEQTKVEALRPFKANARTHSKAQIDQIAASIQASTFANPILIDEEGEIIAGHGRLLAAKKLGLETVPTVRISGLGEGQKRALRLADNKIALNSGWDEALLKEELIVIESLGVQIETTGFSIGERDAIVLGERADPDDVVLPATPQHPVIRRGEVWAAGPHRIACGDVRDAELRQRLMVGALADAAIQDPPFNVKVDGHATGSGRIKHKEFAFASGEMTSGEFTAFLSDALKASAEVSRDGAVHYVFMDHGHMEELLAAAQGVYGRRLNLAVWVKSNAGMGSLYRSHHELVFVFQVGSGKPRNNVELGKHGRNRTNVWDYPSVNTFRKGRSEDLKLHPTVKPVALVADAICDVTAPGELVFDGFLGSGTTLIACERTGRRFAGFEYEPAYVELALTRWRDLTGEEPKRVEDRLALRSLQRAAVNT